MIAGRVTSEREAVVMLHVGASVACSRPVEAVLDTGFTESVALPPDLIEELELSFRGVELAVLADGSETLLDVYWGVVQWHGSPRLIPVMATHGGALLGMALLHGSRLTMDVIEGGQLRLESIPQA